MITGKAEGKRPRGRTAKRLSHQVFEQLEIPVNVAICQAVDCGRWSHNPNYVGTIKEGVDDLYHFPLK